MDDTSVRIINATMNLIMEKGYTATTTKDIAAKAQVNECTIFRKFKGKKEIILSAMERKEWIPDIRAEYFLDCSWDLQNDLERFAQLYFQQVTTKSVKVSIGLRVPELYPYTGERIMKIPATFKEGLISYFKTAFEKNLIQSNEFECIAMMFFNMLFGFVFMKASFQDQLTTLQDEEYVKKAVALFIHGIQ